MIFKTADPQLFKSKCLSWASAFQVFAFLDSNNFSDRFSSFDTLLAVGAADAVQSGQGNSFELLKSFRNKNPGWIVGFLGYDLKNEIENLHSENGDELDFPGLYFFAPKIILITTGDSIEIIAGDPVSIFNTIE